MADAARPAERARFVTVALAAQMFGFRSALACKRFCLRHRVPIKSVGKSRFVEPADLEALIAGERASPANDPPSAEGPDAARVDAAVAKMMRGAK